jgi:hypothetical protein
VTLRNSTIAVIAGVVFTILTYGGLILYLTWPVTEFSITKAGTFGDSFGIITSFFSGLAFAGIILTIILQRQELTESREIFRIQRFEGSFYRLLELYRRNLEDIRIVEHSSDTIYKGIDALNYTCKKLNQTMQKYVRFLEVEDGRMIYEVQLFIEVQKLLHRQARYLGTLQNLLELIERDLSNEDERAPYWNIIASQITSHEARYIFYCCLVSERDDEFRNLMHRAGMIGGRISNGNLSTTHRALYQRVHGVEIPKPRKQLVTPYPRSKFKNLKKRARKVFRNLESAGEA